MLLYLHRNIICNDCVSVRFFQNSTSKKKMPFLLLATKEGAKEKPAKQAKQEKKKPAKPKKPKVQSENSASVAAASAAMAAPKGIVCLFP